MIDHTDIFGDPRIRKCYEGGTVYCLPSHDRHYKRRRRCEHCGKLTDIRTKMHEGMVCEPCAEQLKQKPLKQVIENHGGIGFIRYEYAELTEKS